MFSSLWRKNTQKNKPSQLINQVDCNWLGEYFFIQDGLPRPDWTSIYKHVEQNLQNENADSVWCSIAGKWLEKLSHALPAQYQFVETENFILMSSGDERYNKNLSQFLERCRRRLLFNTKGITRDEGDGKHVVIVLSDIDSYYQYVAAAYGAKGGDYGLSSGMYINNGYGHFVFVEQELWVVEPIAAHEMTHALLSHLTLPLWVNEGMAVNMEAMLTGSTLDGMTASLLEAHQEFWSNKTVQQFWQGESFSRSDEGQRLSYQLAQILVSQLSKDYDVFMEFMNTVNWEDGGESAMKNAYSIGLGDLMAGFLGEGDWQPQPNEWNIGQ